MEKWRKEEIRVCSSRRALPGHSRTFILGGGTNLLISDEGFDGLVLKPEVMKLESNGVMVKVGAGVSVATLLHYCITHNLSGLEWAGGLPGTVGGAIRGNAGAFGGECKDITRSVQSMDIQTQTIRERKAKECTFGYRTSCYKTSAKNEIIISATLALSRGKRNAIRKTIKEKIAYRMARHPMEYPNIGSIFKNVPFSLIKSKPYFSDCVGKAMPVKQDPFPIVPAAYFIHETGLKGVSFGGAMISPKHPNFIVNVCDAASDDVKRLIALAKHEVKERFTIDLEEEIQIV
ncbi:MAG: UDP-N-acetylmuramate dehydrogenase [Candidatus Nealsonbacteria bacterium]|nr:UDP-N-acetylmuramate dehydrogenase [Candidatus Nealsonbacteria bacterium]